MWINLYTNNYSSNLKDKLLRNLILSYLISETEGFLSKYILMYQVDKYFILQKIISIHLSNVW